MPIRSFTGLAGGMTHPVPAGLLAANVGRAAVPPSGGSTIRIGLPHMGMVLSISAEAVDRAADGFDFEAAQADAASSDPVMQRLLGQLEHSADGNDDGGVYADAIRLALAARWLKLRSSESEQRPSDALQKWRLKRVLAHIDDHIGEQITLADLAGAASLSRMYFAARFRAATGQRPHDYILRRRVERAKELLAATERTLVDIALEVGFQTQAHFTTVFKKFASATPGRWRSANRLPA